MTTSILDHCPECDGLIARVHPIADTRIGRRSIPVHREFLQCQGECREAYFALGEGDEEWRRAADIGRAIRLVQRGLWVWVVVVIIGSQTPSIHAWVFPSPALSRTPLPHAGEGLGERAAGASHHA